MIKNSRNYARGSRHPRWNQGKIRRPNGYIHIRVGTDHPLADKYGYAYEHALVWAASGNEPPGKNEILHHTNGDREDNRIENLEIIHRSEHARKHSALQLRDEQGRFVAGWREAEVHQAGAE